MHAFLGRNVNSASNSGASPAAGDVSLVGSSNVTHKGPVQPWVEKYRPKTVDDVVEQAEVVRVLRECLSSGDLPHLLFYGPPGTGKTSSILAAARQLFGSIAKDRVLELNASDERGIQVVRDKVKSFSRVAVGSSRPDGRPCPSFKLVILDEADSMTRDAQSALRRVMEKETRSTRFCLVCNYVSRIIPPLTSRCSKFRFKPLSKNMLCERLKYICDRENLTYDLEALECTIGYCGGDLRRAITCLQSCARLGGRVTKDSVIEVAGLVPENIILKYLNMTDYTELKKFVENFTLEAYSATQLLEQLNEALINSSSLTNVQKTMIAEKMAICEFKLIEGASEKIQLMDLGCTIILALKILN